MDTDDSMLTIPVGNAFETTELTYGFEIRDHAKPNMKGNPLYPDSRGMAVFCFLLKTPKVCIMCILFQLQE